MYFPRQGKRSSRLPRFPWIERPIVRWTIGCRKFPCACPAGNNQGGHANASQKSYRSTTFYTTLASCVMCTGTIIQFRIPPWCGA